jgi:hypothetical protein
MRSVAYSILFEFYSNWNDDTYMKLYFSNSLPRSFCKMIIVHGKKSNLYFPKIIHTQTILSSNDHVIFIESFVCCLVSPSDGVGCCSCYGCCHCCLSCGCCCCCHCKDPYGCVVALDVVIVEVSVVIMFFGCHGCIGGGCGSCSCYVCCGC